MTLIRARFGAPLAALSIVCAGAARADVPTNPAEVLAYLAAHRSDVAVVSYSLDGRGRIDPADPVIRHNADHRLPLASVVKIQHLAVYAREVAAGRLDPALPVRLADWDAFYLPGSDGGAHAAAYERLGIATDELGFALDRDATLPIDALVGAMMRESDNATPDWLLAHLGLGPFRVIERVAGLGEADLPRPLVGGVLARYNVEQGPLTAERLRRLARLQPEAYRALCDRLAARYRTDAAFREAQIAWYLGDTWELDYALEVQAVERLTTSGRAGDYGRILAGVVTGTFLSPAASAVMRRHLELELAPGSPFESVGIKGGSLAGVLNDASWAIPKVGDFAGVRRITVMFLTRLDAATWLGLQEAFPQQVLLFLSAFDRATAEAVKQALAPGRRPTPGQSATVASP